MKKDDINPLFYDLIDQFKEGRMDRREFIRYAALLGISVTFSAKIAGCGPAERVMKKGAMRGGVMRVSAAVHKVTHPAQFSWVNPANQLRQVAEYLTI